MSKHNPQNGSIDGLSRRGTLWQDNRDIGQEKMWPLKHNSEGKAMEEREDKEEGKVLV